MIELTASRSLRIAYMGAACFHSDSSALPSPTTTVRWEEAKDAFERSLELDAGNAEGWLGLGRVCMATGSEDGAEQHYSRCAHGLKTKPK